MNWGKGLALAITVFVIATLSVVSYIISLDFYLVTNEHYEDAVQYQETIDEKKRSSELENPVLVIFDERLESLKIVFPNELIGKVQGDVNFYRPNDPKLDIKFPLSVNTTGTQIIPTSSLEKGKWRMTINWSADSTKYFEEKTIVI